MSEGMPAGLNPAISENAAIDTADRLEQVNSIERQGVTSRNSEAAVSGVHATGRTVEGVQKTEEEKRKIFEQLKKLLDGVENVSDVDRKRRINERYGKGRLGKLNAWLSGADTKGDYDWKEELKRRGAKIGIKGAITGGIAAGAGVVLGGFSLPILAGVFGGAVVGRGVMEVGRMAFGKERRERNEVEKGHQAIFGHIQNLVDESNTFRTELNLDNSENPNYDVEDDPRYLEKVYHIFDLLHDDSKRRVQRVEIPTGDDMETEEKFVALAKGEQAREGAEEINLDEKETELRKHEKKMEKITDIVSSITSIVGGLGVKILGAKMLAEKAAESAATTAGQNAQNAVETFQQGGMVRVDINPGGDGYSHLIARTNESVQYLKGSAENIFGEAVKGLQADILLEKSHNAISAAENHWHKVGEQFTDIIKSINAGELAKAGEIKAGILAKQWGALAATTVGIIGQALVKPGYDKYMRPEEKAVASKKKANEQRQAGLRSVFKGGSESENTRPDGADIESPQDGIEYAVNEGESAEDSPEEVHIGTEPVMEPEKRESSITVDSFFEEGKEWERRQSFIEDNETLSYSMSDAEGDKRYNQYTFNASELSGMQNPKITKLTEEVIDGQRRPIIEFSASGNDYVTTATEFTKVFQPHLIIPAKHQNSEPAFREIVDNGINEFIKSKTRPVDTEEAQEVPEPQIEVKMAFEPGAVWIAAPSTTGETKRIDYVYALDTTMGGVTRAMSQHEYIVKGVNYKKKTVDFNISGSDNVKRVDLNDFMEIFDPKIPENSVTENNSKEKMIADAKSYAEERIRVENSVVSSEDETDNNETDTETPDPPAQEPAETDIRGGDSDNQEEKVGAEVDKATIIGSDGKEIEITKGMELSWDLSRPGSDEYIIYKRKIERIIDKGEGKYAIKFEDNDDIEEDVGPKLIELFEKSEKFRQL